MMILERKEGYLYRKYEQLVDWMNGKSKHNNVDDECCPDFTCCANILPDDQIAKKMVWNFFIEENLEKIREYKIRKVLG